MNIPVIETERLRLRGFELRDLESFVCLNRDPKFVKFFGSGKPQTRFESWNVLAMLVGHWHLYNFGIWLVESKNTGDFIGRVGCWQPEGWPGVEIAWGISPQFWGCGYATEAALASVNWAFLTKNFDELISVIHPENEASKKVAIKIGEKYSSNEIINGKDSMIFSINREEYLKTIK